MLVKPRRERGLALPLFAVVLVLLLVMVAFAADLGVTAQRRRASQNRADAAALAAAQTLGSTQAMFANAATQTSAMAAATTAAKTYVQQNGGIPVADPAWATCVDANALARESATTECISFSNDLTQVRVRVPDETVGYQFASVVGIPTGTVRSSAVAELVTSLGGTTRPILLRAGSAGLNCIEAGGTPECQGYRLDSGDYGTMDSPRYSVVPNGEAPTNYALGLDHMLRLIPTEGVNYCDSDTNGDATKCDDVGGLLNNVPGRYDLANYVLPQPGGALDAATEGLVGENGSQTFEDGGATITALLYRPDGAPRNQLTTSGPPSGPTISFGSSGTPQAGLNGVHISRYIVPAMEAATGCAGAPLLSATMSVNTNAFAVCNAGLSTYITNNLGSSTTVFSRSIVDSPRFGVAPITDSDLGGASEVARITGFYGIYINRIYGTPSGRLKAIEAFVFPLSMIEPVSTGGPGLPYSGGPFSVQLIR